MGKNKINGKINLGGQVALVTGGGRGLGREFALALAGAGASVAVCARSEDQLGETVELIEGKGGRAMAITADVSDRKSVDDMVSEVGSELGPVDLLVNNAGVLKAPGTVWEADPDDWWREIEINLKGPFLCARAVLPSMIERKSGRIINLASIAGLWPFPNFSAYAVSKAALIRLSENIDAEAKEHGISVFSIHPGTVRTSMAKYIAESELVGRRAPEIQEWFKNLLDKGEDEPPESAVRLVLFLASGKADVLSGRYISIDDDVPGLVEQAEKIKEDNLYTLGLRT